MIKIAVSAAIVISCSACSYRLNDDNPIMAYVAHISDVRFDRSGTRIMLQGYQITNDYYIDISCMSLGDEDRESYALQTGSDPVSDLSCYVKDSRLENEYTIISRRDESLNYSPSFFWFRDIGACEATGYKMTASVRGVDVTFIFQNIEIMSKTADMSISIKKIMMR